MKKVSFRNDVLPLKNELYRLALRITLNRADAEDVVQETMLRVWNRRGEWDTIDSIEAYCLTACRNIAIDKQRKAERNGTSLDETDSGDTPDHSHEANPERKAVDTDSLDIVRRLIDSLPEKQRAVMQLRDIEGKSYKEIAAVMEITETQVKVTLFRARQTIKKKFIETEKYGL